MVKVSLSRKEGRRIEEKSFFGLQLNVDILDFVDDVRTPLLKESRLLGNSDLACRSVYVADSQLVRGSEDTPLNIVLKDFREKKIGGISGEELWGTKIRLSFAKDDEGRVLLFYPLCQRSLARIVQDHPSVSKWNYDAGVPDEGVTPEEWEQRKRSWAYVISDEHFGGDSMGILTVRFQDGDFFDCAKADNFDLWNHLPDFSSPKRKRAENLLIRLLSEEVWAGDTRMNYVSPIEEKSDSEAAAEIVSTIEPLLPDPTYDYVTTKQEINEDILAAVRAFERLDG